MMKMKLWSCLTILMVGSVMTWHAAAQEKKPAKEPRGPLPANYGKLGLSDEQKDGLYVIHGEYKAKIDALAEQIKKLQAERDSKLEEKLTAAQKTRLKELRDESAKKAAEAKAKIDEGTKGGSKPAKGADAKPAETKKP